MKFEKINYNNNRRALSPPSAQLVAGFLNSRMPHLLSKFSRSNNQHAFLIWLHLTFLQALLDPCTNKILLIVLAEMGFRTFSFAALAFRTLSLSIFIPQIHYLLSMFTQDLFISKVSSAKVINSTHNVALVFNLRTYNGLPTISSMHIPYRFIFARYLDCMEGMPPMSSSEKETGVELIIIITWWFHVKNKSQREGKGMRPETMSTAPPPVFKT